jgi:hypothetical protein
VGTRTQTSYVSKFLVAVLAITYRLLRTAQQRGTTRKPEFSQAILQAEKSPEDEVLSWIAPMTAQLVQDTRRLARRAATATPSAETVGASIVVTCAAALPYGCTYKRSELQCGERSKLASPPRVHETRLLHPTRKSVPASAHCLNHRSRPGPVCLGMMYGVPRQIHHADHVYAASGEDALV